MKISNSVYSFYNNINNEDLSSNNSNNKLTTFNNKTFTSLFTSNKYFFESNQKNNINNNCSFNKNIMKDSKELNPNNLLEKEMSINKIKFEGINKDDIDIEFLNLKLKKIPIKSKNIKNENYKYIKSLYELQDFMAEGSGINVIKIDDEGKYLTIGFKNGVIKIYEIMNYSYQNYQLIYDRNNLKEYFHFINENPVKTLIGHMNEIINLFWLFSSNIFLISSSLDVVILWNINPLYNNGNCIVKKFHHTDSISCMSINTVHQNMFATGCADKFIRLWSINKNLLEQPSLYNNENRIYNNILNKNKYNECELKEFFVNEEIITINFLQEGDKIAIGTNNGKVLIYSIIPDIIFEYNFNCKNRFGKHVTNINFFSSSTCLISTLDSRIRFVNIKDGSIIHKYKGHKNEKNNIKIGLDLCNDVFISGSENGYCYLWNVFGEDDSVIKNYSYEYFKPFSSKDVINESLIISEKCYVNYFQKILKITNKIMIDSVIINGNDKGRIKITLNINDLY
jgi:WD40 repeat protein